MRYEQAAISVQNEQGYGEVHARLDAAFNPHEVEVFLNRVRKSGLRIRDFEAVAARGLLGKGVTELYGALPVSDQGLTRERYLQLVEAVTPDLRQRYLKVYAYY